MGMPGGTSDLTETHSAARIVWIPQVGNRGGTRPELRLPPSQLERENLCGRKSAGSPESVRPFKAIFCDDISEFESSHPSQPVWSLYVMSDQPERAGTAGATGGLILAFARRRAQRWDSRPFAGQGRSSIANRLYGQNSAGFAEIGVSFQREIEHAMVNPPIPPWFWRGVNNNQNAPMRPARSRSNSGAS
jgi:hypothetical protein